MDFEAYAIKRGIRYEDDTREFARDIWNRWFDEVYPPTPDDSEDEEDEIDEEDPDEKEKREAGTKRYTIKHKISAQFFFRPLKDKFWFARFLIRPVLI